MHFNWDMLENALQITIVLLSHRFTLISPVSSTDVNERGLGMAPRGTKIRKKMENQNKASKCGMNLLY